MDFVPAIALVRSQFMRHVERDDRAIIWHSLFGHPRIVSLDTLTLLEAFESPTLLHEVSSKYELGPEGEGIIQKLLQSCFLVPVGFDERAVLEEHVQRRTATILNGNRLDNLSLIMAETCNFRCRYCIHFENLATSARLTSAAQTMNFNVAREGVDQFLGILQRTGKNVAEINFGGGEPLLAWPVIWQVLRYCRERYSGEFSFSFSLNTNASLMTERIARTLKEHRCHVAVSLDGLEDGNDRVRLSRGGRGTFKNIVQGIDALAAVGYPIDGVAVTVTEDNFSAIDESIIDWAADRGMTIVRIDPDVIGMVDAPLAEISARLMRLWRYAQGKGIDVAGFWSRPAENLNESTLLEPVSFCGGVRGNSMCVSPSGKIFLCGYSTEELGQLSEIDSFFDPQGRYCSFVRSRETGRLPMCRGCSIEGQCGGGCQITREFSRTANTDKVQRTCDFYRLMTGELLLEQLMEMGNSPSTAERRNDG